MSRSDDRGAPCTRCAHYFITFDARFPYGCRAMGFKCRRSPRDEVLATTGQPCEAFAAKAPPRRRKAG